MHAWFHGRRLNAPTAEGSSSGNAHIGFAGLSRLSRLVVATGLTVVLSAGFAGCDSEDSDSGEDASTLVDIGDITKVECNSALDCEFTNGALSNACETYACNAHVCETVPAPANTPCGGGSGTACVMTACDGEGACVDRAAFDMTPCGDNDGCSGAFCIDGSCVTDYAIITCDDFNPCTTDMCDNGSCIYTKNTNPCDDGDACTLDDTCKNGRCIGTPSDSCPCDVDSDCIDDGNDCNGKEVCTDNFCVSDPDTAVDCTTAPDSCQVATCVPANGSCSVFDLPGGTPCDDGDECTENDKCINQECLGTPIDDCTPDDETK